MKEGLVSIIMPVFNGGRYLKDAIQSVLDQQYQEWELLLVDNGSTDTTPELIRSFTDPRIRALQEANKGVSAARNRALAEMKGEFFCFLDADDIFSTNSLGSRVDAFAAHPDWQMVDGQVIVMDERMEKTRRIYRPAFCGNPRQALLSHDDNVFFGQTWMWRRRQDLSYQFRTDLSHGEDWWFCFQYGSGNTLGFVEESILKVRSWSGQATKQLRGLEDGYLKISELLGDAGCAEAEVRQYREKAQSIMWKSYLKAGHPFEALRVLSGKFG